MKKDDVLSDWNEENEQIDQKNARKLVWRTRISIGFTVIRTLLLVLLLYLLYVIPMQVYYDMSGKQAGFDRMVTTLVETRNPGITVDKSGAGQSASINPLLTQKTTQTVYRRVGDWEVAAGKITAKKRLFGKLHYTLDLKEKYLNDDFVSSFAIAPDLLGEDSLAEDAPTGFSLSEQLNKIEDGYVAQVKFAAKQGMAPGELIDLLADYNVEIYQMAVYGGEITEINMPFSRAGQFTFASTLLLRPATEYDDKNRHSSSYLSLTTKESLAAAEKQFFEDLEWLIENGNYPDKKIDEQRLDYLNQHGIQVFGATVTGPVREIERLEEKELLHQFQLGGIEVWKWQER
ncbi:anti sigma factor C-terminal domain-containing protein [Sediminibacillus albus]|uniref:Sigma factor regulator C-terminal n=1 Tax=Sediminibacillus albus TaxID=407036 RepID=A0A1G8VI28_9BACI|nr:anti sigma factor C-terminal domain-containing protein [Sediminibacillus albus]SDJ65663.1 Sigma factor regulator C-terminal [Sediminibacillus albus]